MKRFMAAAVSLLMTFALATVSTVAGPVSTASAAPPGGGTVYGATGTGQILGLDANVLPILGGGLNLANVGVATTNATTGASQTPRSAATSSNIKAAVVGLPLTVVSSGQTAPPDNAAPTTGGLPTINVNIPLLLQLSLSALQVSNQARWAGDTSCVASGLLSDSKTTTGDTSLTLAGTNLLTLAAADVQNTNALVNTVTNVGLNKALRSTAVGTVTDLQLLNGGVVVTVTGNPTLTATATGSPGGATVTSNAGSLVVSVKIGAGAAVVVPLGGSIPIAGLGTLSVNAPTNIVQNANGQNASASWDFLTLDVNLAVASANVNLLSITASATAPSGGLDCPAAIPSAPVIVVPSDDETVTTATPTISGTAEPNATVNVTIDGAATPITTTADINGDWSITSPVLANGAHTATATQTVAGATSPASLVRNFTVAVAAPAAPTITDPDDNTVSNDRTPVIVGTGVAGNTVTVFDGATLLGTAPVNGSGIWTLTSPQLSEGLHTFTATQQAATGPASAVSNAVRYTVDITAPPILTIATPLQNSTITDATPEISGSGAEDGATVIVREGGTELCRVTVTTGPGWSCTPASELAEGSHTITATQTDVAGNVGPVSADRTFTVDSLAPAAVTIVTPAQNSTVTDNTPTITGGGAEAGATVVVTEGGTELCRVTVVSAGSWSCTPATELAEGSHTIVATQTDAAGNVGTPSADRTFIVDAVAPGILTIALPAQNSTVTDATPEISGSGAEDGATVIVREGGTELCRVTVATGPGWACTPATELAEGSHTITATQTDAAGNVGPVSADRTFNVDSLAPLAVTIATPAQNAVVTDDTPTITGGGAEAGATIIVTEDGTELCRVTAITAGAWSCTPTTPLDQGSHTIVATQTDAVGNVGPASDPRTFVVDSEAPAAVTITTPAQNSTVTDDTPTIIGGGAEAGATIIVTEGGAELCRVTVVTAGTWSCTPSTPLDQGLHTIVATQTDAAGNVGPASLPRTFSIDSINPLAVVIQTPVDGSFLSNARPIISGTGAEAGATVIVKEGATEVCRVTVVLAGAWSCIPPADLAEGSHTIVATQTDLAGNVSPNSNTVTFTVDTVNPNRPIISTPTANAQVTGASVPVTGTGEAFSTISVTVTTGLVTFGPLTAPIDVNGRWSVTFSGLAPAQYVAAAFQTDRAANRSPLPDPTRPFEVVSDVRDAPVIASPTTSTVAVSNNRPVIRGTGVAGALLTVRDLADSSKILGTATVGTNGAWTVTLAADLADGPHQFRATQAGTNGVPSSPSNVVDYVVDTKAAAPRITAPASSTTKPQNTRTPRITGNGAEPGATIVVRDGGKVICTTIATASGTWTCTPPELAEGSHTITATQTDKAGNTSPASAPVTFVIEIRLAITSPPRLNRTKDNTPSVGGTSDEVGAQVTVSKRATVWCRTTVRSNKTWSCSSPNRQPDGFHLVSASARSVGGFTKNAAAPILIVIDTLRPGAPRITSPSPNAQVPVGSVNVRGTGAPGGTITLRDERGTARGEVFVSLNGTWTISVKGLTAGPHSFTATQIDGAKNVSAASGKTVITLAGTNGVAGVRTPVIDPTLDKASVSTTSLRISGVGQRGATIVITDERGVRSGSVPVSSSGNWALTFPSSPQGIHRYTATQTYKVGARITSVKSQVVQLRLDTTRPAAPTLEAPLPGDVQATTLPAFGGSAEPGVVVEATIDGKVIQPRGGLKGALSDNDRRWILLSTVAVGPGTHTLRLVAVDPAGNRSGTLTTSIRTK